MLIKNTKSTYYEFCGLINFLLYTVSISSGFNQQHSILKHIANVFYIVWIKLYIKYITLEEIRYIQDYYELNKPNTSQDVFKGSMENTW